MGSSIELPYLRSAMEARASITSSHGRKLDLTSRSGSSVELPAMVEVRLGFQIEAQSRASGHGSSVVEVRKKIKNIFTEAPATVVAVEVV